MMSKEAREAKNKYRREYMKAHPGKAREYAERYWAKKSMKDVPERGKGE